MKTKFDFFVRGGCRWIGSVLFLFLMTAVLTCAQWPATASASQPLTWTESDVNLMWSGYTNDFLAVAPSGHKVFVGTAGTTTITGFWEEAEEIEMAEDGYYWAKTYGIGSTSGIANIVNDACAGFVAHNGSLWYADTYDDDKNWAEIAFARAYQITGNSSWLSAATNNFNYVWKYGQVNGVTDGSWGLTQVTNTQRMYANVNFTFVIAGYLLYDITGNTNYKSEADAIYAWSKTNLYVYNHLPARNGSTNVCSMIYNYNNSEFGKAIQNRDCMYNYGIAIQAAYYEHDTNMARTVANWMIYNVDADPAGDGVAYAGTYDGYNVLPDYGAGTTNSSNDCGYDGIGLRGFGVALRNGLLTNPDALLFAQANMQSAWNHRTVDNVEWCGWATTPSGTRFSWGDSAAMAGMFDIPAPINPPQLAATWQSPNLVLSWSSYSTNFAIETNSNLNTTNWASGGYPISVNSGTNQSAIVPAPTGTLFFRLAQ